MKDFFNAKHILLLGKKKNFTQIAGWRGEAVVVVVVVVPTTGLYEEKHVPPFMQALG